MKLLLLTRKAIIEVSHTTLYYAFLYLWTTMMLPGLISNDCAMAAAIAQSSSALISLATIALHFAQSLSYPGGASSNPADDEWCAIHAKPG